MVHQSGLMEDFNTRITQNICLRILIVQGTDFLKSTKTNLVDNNIMFETHVLIMVQELIMHTVSIYMMPRRLPSSESHFNGEDHA